MSFPKPQKQTFSGGESGVQDPIVLREGLKTLFYLSAGASDDVTVEVNVSLDKGFTWDALDTTLTNFINSAGFFTPIQTPSAIRLNLNAVAVNVVFEVNQVRVSG